MPLQWYNAVELLTPHIVKVLTPTGFGTGFLLHSVETGTGSERVCAFATAYHVVAHAHQWDLPIKLERAGTGQIAMYHGNERAIFVDEENDTAAIVAAPKNLELPSSPFPLIPAGNHIKVGVPMGWLGFPTVLESTLCFFSGKVSAYRPELRKYFVDGVAINGVSGGPAFYVTEGATDRSLHLVGVVSAYLPNTQPGTNTPGLSVVRDVQHLQNLTALFKSVDEARRKQEDNPPVQPVAPLTTTTEEPTKC